MVSAVVITRLEKAASDNGFDLCLRSDCAWLHFGSSQTSIRVWLRTEGGALFVVALSRADVLEALSEFGRGHSDLLPLGAAGARSVSGFLALHGLLRRAFQLSRTLPDELLQIFECET